MSEYQNIFTQVQIRGPVERGVVADGDDWPRGQGGGFSYLLGLIGNAQLGPVYLGVYGIASLICGFIAIEIIGLNMMAQVNWDPIQFVRQFNYLSLKPP
ncbi:MAG: photosynthetic reaction center subunit M, partial [Pseudomonadota bacterium]